MYAVSDQLLLQYFQKVQEALLKFQFIEEALRMYVARCYEIINYKVSGNIPFKYDYNDLQKDALGTLLKKFKKFTDNEQLIKDIEAIIKDRNYCAHQAYLLTSEEQKNSEYLADEIKKADIIIARAEECRQLISAELRQIDEIKNHLKEPLG